MKLYLQISSVGQVPFRPGSTFDKTATAIAERKEANEAKAMGVTIIQYNREVEAINRLRHPSQKNCTRLVKRVKKGQKLSERPTSRILQKNHVANFFTHTTTDEYKTTAFPAVELAYALF